MLFLFDQVPEGYALSEAITCLLDTVHSLGQAGDAPSKVSGEGDSEQHPAGQDASHAQAEDYGASVIGVEAGKGPCSFVSVSVCAC